MNYDEFLSTLNNSDFWDAVQIEHESNARAAVIAAYNEFRMSPEQLHAIANEMAQREANTDYKTSQQAIAFNQGVYS